MNLKNESIKTVLPKMVSIMLLLFLLFLLPVNLYIQMYMQHQTQRKSTTEMFGQLEQLIQANESELGDAEQEFKERCILAANLVAYHLEQLDKSMLDVTASRELAEKMDVDEIHFFTPDGEIVSGTHPQYYGFTFDSGEQMRFFKPMLQDRSLKLCQDITPNTAEQKEMQYAAVWLDDGSGIVQIGMEPRRLQQIMEENSLHNILEEMPFEVDGYLHVLDKKTYEIIASTSPKLNHQTIFEAEQLPYGKQLSNTIHLQYDGINYCVYTKEYQDYILVRMYNSFSPVTRMLQSSGIVILYVLVGSIGIIMILRWYIQHKLSNNLAKIVCELQKIEKGSLDEIHIQTGIREFEELLLYINQMLNSVQLSRKHFLHLLNKSEIPFGFFEKNTFYHQTFYNHKLLEILEIEEHEPTSSEMQDCLEEKINEIKKYQISGHETIYQYCVHGKKKYLQLEQLEDAQSIAYYIADITHLWEEASQIKLQSQVDELTQLYNRRGFNEQMNLLFESPDALGFAAMLMIDADDLKAVNDTYGHFMGDRYLKAIAETLQTTTKEKSISARLGGDEFAVFLYGFSCMADLESMIAQIKEERGSVFVQEKNYRQTLQFSIGAAFHTIDGTNFHDLMQIADERMYQDKKSRKIKRF